MVLDHAHEYPSQWRAIESIAEKLDIVVTSEGERHVVATFDGRYLSVEAIGSFTGRVAGVYCTRDQLCADRFEEADL